VADPPLDAGLLSIARRLAAHHHPGRAGIPTQYRTVIAVDGKTLRGVPLG
jgi:hypothetical protein